MFQALFWIRVFTLRVLGCPRCNPVKQTASDLDIQWTGMRMAVPCLFPFSKGEVGSELPRWTSNKQTFFLFQKVNFQKSASEIFGHANGHANPRSSSNWHASPLTRPVDRAFMTPSLDGVLQVKSSMMECPKLWLINEKKGVPPSYLYIHIYIL